MYAEAFLVGVTYGFTVCSWSCMPYLCPYVMGIQAGFVRGIGAALVFSFGKLVSYVILGGFAGYLGGMLSEYPRAVFPKISALIIVWLGCTLLFKGKSGCGTKGGSVWRQNMPNVHLALLGLTAGMTPCLPMSGVLLYASTNDSPAAGCLIAAAFGLGTMLSPLTVIAGGMGWLSKDISRKIPRHSRMLRKICGFVLLSIGVKLFVF